MNPPPILSVCMITYNHERYIEQAVQSALMQVTDFGYEIVIGEDCSTDRTREVLLRLDSEHPGRLRLLLRDQNLGPARNFHDTYAACRGDYVAILEGDDYWTDPEKLRRQVHKLREHPDWSACFHPVRYVNQLGEDTGRVHPQQSPPLVETADLFGQNLIQTCSIVLRRQLMPTIPSWFCDLKLCDWPLFLLLAEAGSIGFLPEAMACYREHPDSVWSSRPFRERLYETLRTFWVLGNKGGPQLRAKLALVREAFQALENAEVELGTTRGCLADTRRELEVSTGEARAARSALAAAEAELGATRGGLAATQGDLQAIREELVAARAAHEAALSEARAEVEAGKAEVRAVRGELEAAQREIAKLNGALSLRLARAVGMPFVRMAQVVDPAWPAANHSADPRGRGRAAEIWSQVHSVLRHEGFGALLRESWRFLREGPKVPSAAAHGPTEDIYLRWIQKNEPDAGRLAQQRRHRFAHTPLLSILVPVYQTPPPFLQAMIASVQAQTYTHWELCLADGNSPNGEVRRLLEELAARDCRIRVRLLEENRGIAGNSAAALELATGSYVALLDHDDLLPPFALFEVVRAINEHPDADMLYSDEDHIDEQGRRFTPHFKPDWSPDTLEGHNYICHLLVLSRQLLYDCGGFREGFEGSQDYDLVLRAGEQARRIVHIPRVLYHWRVHSQSFSQATTRTEAFEAGRRAIEAHLERINTPGRVEHGPLPGTYQVIRSLPRQPLVSIIIPTHDQHQTLDCCLKSIARSSYRSYEILLAENHSKEPETFAYYKQLADRPEIRLLTWKKPFNYAAVNNWAAAQTRGEVLLLLNNDTEARNADWLERMLEHALRPEVGAVGAKLYYPDGSIQHGGVIVGIGGIAGHAHRFFASSSDGYFHRLIIAQNLSAVTGACLMLRREVFDAVGGLDERYILAFNDVDFCLRIRQKGYRVIWTPFAQLSHHEIKTRGTEDTPEKVARFEAEFRTFQETWRGFLEAGDPFYSPNLSLTHEDFSLRV